LQRINRCTRCIKYFRTGEEKYRPADNLWTRNLTCNQKALASVSTPESGFNSVGCGRSGPVQWKVAHGKIDQPVSKIKSEIANPLAFARGGCDEWRNKLMKIALSTVRFGRAEFEKI
jgi:hypothetical protein